MTTRSGTYHKPKERMAENVTEQLMRMILEDSKRRDEEDARRAEDRKRRDQEDTRRAEEHDLRMKQMKAQLDALKAVVQLLAQNELQSLRAWTSSS